MQKFWNKVYVWGRYYKSHYQKLDIKGWKRIRPIDQHKGDGIISPINSNKTNSSKEEAEEIDLNKGDLQTYPNYSDDPEPMESVVPDRWPNGKVSLFNGQKWG